MIRSASIVLAALGSLGAACAIQGPPAQAAGPTPARQCFLARQVNGYSPVADDIVDVQVGANHYYRLQLSGSCPNSVWSHRVALRTTGGGSWICQGLDAEIIVPDPAGVERCLVTDVRPITKADWIAGRHPHK